VPPVSLKSDASFLEKLAVGATGTKATIERLQVQGFQPIELERGSTGYKIWKKIKIKRVRVPDILCLRSGQRFESRGKTKLEISMSHSLKDPYRAWDYGMRPDDQVAILLCAQGSSSPVDWKPASPIHFIKVSDMREAVKNNLVKTTKPKGVEEGSEIRMIWPTVAANEASVVTEITERSLKLQPENGKKQLCVLKRKASTLIPQCKVGDIVQAKQIVASVVPLQLDPRPLNRVDEKYFITQLKSASLSERYAAAKALRFRGYDEAGEYLKARMVDEAEDIYVRLEAAAALAGTGDELGWTFLSDCIDSEFLTVQLEAVIVLSEIPDPRSEQLLIVVLTNATRDSEVRAGAAWALGEFPSEESASALTNAFDLTSTEIKTEAARALLKITPSQLARIINILKSIEPIKRDGIAWALARTGGFDPKDLIGEEIDDNLRRWTSYIVGYGKDLLVEEQIKELATLNPEVHFAASVLWQILASWVYGLEEY
jgi:HEAT repeat protein